MQIFYSYLRYTDRVLNVFFLLLSVISKPHENPRRKIELQKKVHIRICVRTYFFLTAHPPYVIFCCFFAYSPDIFVYRASNGRKLATCKQVFFPKQACWLMSEEIHCITNKEKTAKNEWENDDWDFLGALNSVYKRLG